MLLNELKHYPRHQNIQASLFQYIFHTSNFFLLGIPYKQTPIYETLQTSRYGVKPLKIAFLERLHLSFFDPNPNPNPNPDRP